MAEGNVMAGFPNPLPDTLHLLLVSFSVYTCVFGRAYATWPGCATCVSRAVVVDVSRPPLYISSRARTTQV